MEGFNQVGDAYNRNSNPKKYLEFALEALEICEKFYENDTLNPYFIKCYNSK